jgi:hypothetical protein
VVKDEQQDVGGSTSSAALDTTSGSTASRPQRHRQLPSRFRERTKTEDRIPSGEFVQDMSSVVSDAAEAPPAYTPTIDVDDDKAFVRDRVKKRSPSVIPSVGSVFFPGTDTVLDSVAEPVRNSRSPSPRRSTGDESSEEEEATGNEAASNRPAVPSIPRSMSPIVPPSTRRLIGVVLRPFFNQPGAVIKVEEQEPSLATQSTPSLSTPAARTPPPQPTPAPSLGVTAKGVVSRVAGLVITALMDGFTEKR